MSQLLGISALPQGPVSYYSVLGLVLDIVIEHMGGIYTDCGEERKEGRIRFSQQHKSDIPPVNKLFKQNPAKIDTKVVIFSLTNIRSVLSQGKLSWAFLLQLHCSNQDCR